ncbi:MAG TPA: acyl-CoA thioesterase domain-containing protein [Williamsia sp.]
MSDLSYYTQGADGFTLIPTSWARSVWDPNALNGPAVCAAAAHALERDFSDPDFVPSRLTIDMFKSARNAPTVINTRKVRSGHRIVVADAEVMQDDTMVARASIVFLRRSAPPPGNEWRPETTFTPPEHAFDNKPRFPYMNTDGNEWTQSIGGHQNVARKRAWSTGMAVLPGEPCSPFVHAVQSAESTSLVTNLGTEGIGYINCDLTMALSRIPEGHELGIEADTHITADGISVGTATLYDRKGPYGTGMVTAVSNPAAQIDFSARKGLL